MRAMAWIRAICFVGAALTFACLKPEATAPATDGSTTTIGDDNRLAGATSSTNWPPEDDGTQPIQVFGTADSVLSFSFMQAPEMGSIPVPTRLAATILLYRTGYNPLFDSIPTLHLDFPISDTCKVTPEDFKPLMADDIDTVRFTVEIRTDTVRGLFTGFSYSKKQKKFLEWPFFVNTLGSTNLSGPHYDFVGIPDSGFRAFQSDTSGNAKFYYYIAGSPYFWPQSLGHDSLYIGPTVLGKFPLRCVKLFSEPGPKPVFTIEVYALTLVKELVNDTLHHTLPSTIFKLGDPILRLQEQGKPQLRAPK